MAEQAQRNGEALELEMGKWMIGTELKDLKGHLEQATERYVKSENAVLKFRHN